MAKDLNPNTWWSYSTLYRHHPRREDSARSTQLRHSVASTTKQKSGISTVRLFRHNSCRRTKSARKSCKRLLHSFPRPAYKSSRWQCKWCRATLKWLSSLWLLSRVNSPLMSNKQQLRPHPCLLSKSPSRPSRPARILPWKPWRNRPLKVSQPREAMKWRLIWQCWLTKLGSKTRYLSKRESRMTNLNQQWCSTCKRKMPMSRKLWWNIWRRCKKRWLKCKDQVQVVSVACEQANVCSRIERILYYFVKSAL